MQAQYNQEEFEQENIKTMISRLEDLWKHLEQFGIPRRQILQQAWLAPARCCLVNADGATTVEKSFRLLQQVADHYKEELP